MSDRCDLCGLALRAGAVSAVFAGRSYRFCCLGCRQVFTILLESGFAADPDRLRETDLFKQCQARGIIPASDADLEGRQSRPAPPKPLDPADPELLTLHLKIRNMWCPACAWLIDETVRKTTGVVTTACSFATDRLQIAYHPLYTSPGELCEIISRLGYQTMIPGESVEARERRREFIRFCLSAFLTMNIMMLSFALYSGFFTELPRDDVYKLGWPAFVMATFVLVYGGREFFRKAWSALRHAAYGMETLILLGSLSAYLYSTVNLLSGSIDLYFDTAAMLITLVLLGKNLERRAKGKVMADLEHFLALQPRKVRVMDKQLGQGRYVDAAYLKAGDHFMVVQDEIIAADGRVTAGSGSVDESSLTGEARPVAVELGDSVKSGTRLRRGQLTVRAERTGDQSTLGQMIRIIEQTLRSKTPLEGKTDVLLRWFVPLVALLAVGTFAAGRLMGLAAGTAILRAVTVLVISCPCALGIAIPLARVAGVSLAGKRGILVRDFCAFEKAGRIGAVVFDKTGTLTEGNWTLVGIRVREPFTEDQVLGLAAGLEERSDHVVAQEIRDYAGKRHVRPPAVDNLQIHDNGVCGTVNGQLVKIGSVEFVGGEVEATELPTPGAMSPKALLQSRVSLEVDGHLAATFSFGDTLRAGAEAAVAELQACGYHLALISGDGEATTQAVGRRVGIEESLGNQTPANKAEFVRGLQQSGQRVAMAGDGINDAAALVQADLSLAVYSGGQLGQETADVTLMRSDPGQVIEFVRFAELVDKRIRQNLAFTFLYNLLAIPVAMSGYLNPLVAVCAMMLSSLSVTTNTLMLNRKAARTEVSLRGAADPDRRYDGDRSRCVESNTSPSGRSCG
jgi:heavy metal translocating P-type ATPase